MPARYSSSAVRSSEVREVSEVSSEFALPAAVTVMLLSSARKRASNTASATFTSPEQSVSPGSCAAGGASVSCGSLSVVSVSAEVLAVVVVVVVVVVSVVVVAADEGVMPQTLEHLHIIHLLGIENTCKLIQAYLAK